MCNLNIDVANAFVYKYLTQFINLYLFFLHISFKRSPPASRKFSTGNAGNVQPNSHLSSTTARNTRSRSRSPAVRKTSTTVPANVESSQVS